MEINKDIKELILEYVKRYFKFENDFYRLLRASSLPMPTGKNSRMEILPSRRWGQHE